MPNFKYEGRDKNGNLMTGERTADSAESLSTQLSNEDIIPINILLQDKGLGWFSQLQTLFVSKKVSTKDFALFARQMYTLTKSGVSMSIAIKHLGKGARNTYFSHILTGIADKIESGQDLSTAMEAYPNIFSPLMISMIRIGQNTGRLDQAFLRLSEYLELKESTTKRIKSAIRYPIFVVSTIIIGIIIINIFVIPVFAKVYQRANVTLPWVTLLLINISNFIVHYWMFLLIFIVICAIGILRYLNSPQGKYNWDKYKLKIPTVGFLLKRMLLQQFSETFAIVVNSGVPIIQGLDLVSASINNEYVRTEVKNMKSAIERGSSIYNAASACALFTELELQMLAISEDTGELGGMLNEIALYYRREVDYDLKHLMDIIEPLLLAGIALMVLFMALAVYLPIWEMVKLVHKT